MESRVKIINYKPLKRNNLCHWCNKNKLQNKINYVDCNLCSQTYCNICIIKLPYIKPNDRGCLYCQKICNCITDTYNLGHCYKKRISTLIDNLKLKNNNKNEEDESTISNIDSSPNSKRIFTTAFDTKSSYILDSSSNICLKPYKKRKFIKQTDV